MFDKPIENLDKSDIETLISRSVSESDTIEFKADLPCANGLDSWHTDKSKGVGDYARNKLMSEIISFANSIGGTLILGVEETEDSPPRANGLNPIPHCSDLASRLEQQAGSCIEPQIPRLRIRGVPFDDDDHGIVIAVIGRSNLAPHRLKHTMHCYTRRGERTEKMTMREIRDSVLTTRDIGTFVDQRFSLAKSQFDREFAEYSSSAQNIRALSIRAVPLDPDSIYYDALQTAPKVSDLISAIGTLPNPANTNQRPFEAQFPGGTLLWRPMLRGAVGCYDRTDATTAIRFETQNNGDIHLRLFLIDDDFGSGGIFPGWVAGLFANVIAKINSIKQSTGQYGSEYGVEACIRTLSDQPIMLKHWWGDSFIFHTEERFLPEEVTFPRYRITEDLSKNMNLFVKDMWHAVGLHAGNDAKAEWRFK